MGSSRIPAMASHRLLSLPLPESYVSLSTHPCHKAVSCYQGSEMLPCLQTNPVSWQKTQNSWVRDRRLWSLWHSRQHGLHVPLPSSPTAKSEADLGGCCAHSGFISQLRNPEWRNFQSYKGTDASKPAQSLSWGDSKQTCSLLWRETRLSSEATCCVKILRKIVQNKSCKETKGDPWDLSPSTYCGSPASLAAERGGQGEQRAGTSLPRVGTALEWSTCQ